MRTMQTYTPQSSHPLCLSDWKVPILQPSTDRSPGLTVCRRAIKSLKKKDQSGEMMKYSTEIGLDMHIKDDV